MKQSLTAHPHPLDLAAVLLSPNERGIQLGLIAQEAETVVPELVSTDKSPEQTKGINYIGLLPVTINAIPLFPKTPITMPRDSNN
jgi:hypothetical protein